MLEACVFATILCGFFGIILKKNTVTKTIIVDAISTGAIDNYVMLRSQEGLFAAEISANKNVAYTDPVPEAIILTSIVIGFLIQALNLVGAMKLTRDNPILESKENE